MAFSFVRSLVKYSLKCVGDGLTGGVVPIGSIAAGVFEDWYTGGDPKPGAAARAPAPEAQVQFRAELERIAQDNRAFRQQVETFIAQSKQSEEVKRRALAYLNQVPGRIQASLRRPEDPTGRTVPANIVLRRAEDLQQLLPDRMPRFKPGDRAVPGTDLVVEELLGVGGFGEVWKAVHSSRPHARAVALKFCTDEAAARSLRKEVELLDRVATQGRHEGIVELKYAHLEGDTPCLEYEFVDGGDLAALTTDLHKAGQATPVQIARIVYYLALPIGFAHRRKPPIVHRDLKPQNILTTRAEGKLKLKVADFGIGGVASTQAIHEWAGETRPEAPGLTQSAGSCTPLYASPQQRRFGPPDPRDDVYALGVIWYQMLAGDLTREPPRGGSWKKRFIERGATQDMIALLERCIEDDPAERPADAQALADGLAAILRAAPAPSAGSPAGSPAGSVPTAAPAPTAEQWHYARGGRQTGPVSLEELKKLVADNRVAGDDVVWTARLGNWAPARTVRELWPQVLAAAPVESRPAKPPAPPPPARDDDVVLAEAADEVNVEIVVPPRSMGWWESFNIGEVTYKYYLEEEFVGDGTSVKGTNLCFPAAVGRHEMKVIALNSKGKQIGVCTREIRFTRGADFEIRFTPIVLDGSMGDWFKNFNKSSLEVMRKSRR